jgi:hypothetical protein
VTHLNLCSSAFNSRRLVFRQFAGMMFILVPLLSFSQTSSRFIEYLSPEPGAALVSQQSNIIIRMKTILDPSSVVDPSSILVVGSKSSEHSGSLTLSDDRKTLVFEPLRAFASDEVVTVTLRPELFPKEGKEPQPLEFQFNTSLLSSLDQEAFLSQWRTSDLSFPRLQTSHQEPAKIALDSLPTSLPPRTIIASGATAPGSLFLASFKIAEASDHLFFVSLVPSDKQYLMILDNLGKPLYYKPMRSMSTDFKMQPNGNLTYYDDVDNAYYELDSNYNVIDSFRAGNGYRTDVHDLVVLPNGHALLMAYDPEFVDMSKIVPGGNPYATVIGAIIQELDQNKKVIFQWRSFDHFQVTDATKENMTAATIDAVHPNTIEVDTDGNLLLSSRHMDEITKINLKTGETIWRWGGKNNQFKYTNDTIGFSHQHTIRRTPTGTLMLFDNGNYRTSVCSRAIEYSVDEKAKTATLVWQYKHSPDIRAIAMGSVQRLPNGNTLIGWGSSGPGSPAITEVRPDRSIAFELQLPDSIVSYRAFRFPWKQTSSATEVTSAGGVPEFFSLDQNYPNPFNPTTRIQFSLPKATTVNLGVFDLLGRSVATLVDGWKPAGTYSVQFDGSGLATGIYLYRLSTTENSLVKVMALIK